MDEWFDQLIPWVFAHLPAGKDSLKSFAYDHGLGPVWDVTRDYVFSYKVWLLGLLPCLLLERWRPAVALGGAPRASVKLDILYPVFTGVLILPFVTLLVESITGFYHRALPFLGIGLLANQPPWFRGLGAFLAGDFALYLSHVVRHKVKWAWYFHTIHHSEEQLNPMATHRVHAGEGVINAVVRTVPIALIGGSPITWTVFLVLNNFWGYFIHANIRTNLGPLRFILVTPQFHRVHHSVQPVHFDRNYGERLIVWDWLFGTLVRDFECYPATGVKGIERWVVETDQSWRALTVTWVRQTMYPFYRIGRSIGGGLGLIYRPRGSRRPGSASPGTPISRLASS